MNIRDRDRDRDHDRDRDRDRDHDRNRDHDRDHDRDRDRDRVKRLIAGRLVKLCYSHLVPAKEPSQMTFHCSLRPDMSNLPQALWAVLSVKQSEHAARRRFRCIWKYIDMHR